MKERRKERKKRKEKYIYFSISYFLSSFYVLSFCPFRQINKWAKCTNGHKDTQHDKIDKWAKKTKRQYCRNIWIKSDVPILKVLQFY